MACETPKPLSFLDFFSGVGGFRAGLEQAGMRCLGHCEIDKFADKSYRAIHDLKEDEWFANDIVAVLPADLPRANLWCAGFPCTDISTANNRRLGLDGARSGLFFELVRLLDGLPANARPDWLLLENVKAVLHIHGGWDMFRILHSLAERGYHCEYGCLDSSRFGVPQHRERVFIVARRLFGDGCRRKIFPVPCGAGKALRGLNGRQRQGKRIYDADGVAQTLMAGSGGFAGKTGLYAVGFNRREGVTGPLETACTLMASDCRGLNRNQTQTAVFVDLSAGAMKQTETARCLVSKYDSGIGRHKGEKSGVLAGGRIRKLTPREAWRLQGFSDAQFDKAAAVNSDAQLYRQAGNGVTVPVIAAIGRQIVLANGTYDRFDKDILPSF
ncbi:MAG: DNA (cytosine-5-)-methyltransferase [Oscillospiraceae bacterium]|jgi:DNA (cytosine-5)-methyltransferase 1|nr:DNA (cytosine-5-)-methyltransferase [Oscillospiraceae bacterium]